MRFRRYGVQARILPQNKEAHEKRWTDWTHPVENDDISEGVVDELDDTIDKRYRRAASRSGRHLCIVVPLGREVHMHNPKSCVRNACKCEYEGG
jgi:hypothetical protein